MKKFLDAPKSSKLEIITYEGNDYVNLRQVYDACGASTLTNISGYKRGVKHYIEVGDKILVKISDVLPFIRRLRNVLGVEMYNNIVDGDYVKEAGLVVEKINDVAIKSETVIKKAGDFEFIDGMRVILTTENKYMLGLIDLGWELNFSESYRNVIFSDAHPSEKLTIRNNDNSVHSKYISFDAVKLRIGKRNFRKIDALYEEAKIQLPIAETKEKNSKDTKIGRVSGEYKTSEHNEQSKIDDYIKQIEVLRSKVSELEAEVKESDEVVSLLNDISVKHSDAIKTSLKHNVAKSLNMIEFIDKLSGGGDGKKQK